MAECSKCQVQFEKPLIDFLGKWFCPSCKAEIFPNEQTQLVVTPQSRTYYVRSQRLFNQGYLLGKLDELGYTRQLALKEAVRQCKYSAVNLNDPYALLSLAFYYENGYIEESVGDTSRFNMALKCNQAICFNKNHFISKSTDNLRARDDSTDLSDREETTLRFEAGLNILRLLNSIPSSINMSPEKIKAYDVIENRVRAKILEVSERNGLLDIKKYEALPSDIILTNSETYSATNLTCEDFVENLKLICDEKSPALMQLAYLSSKEMKRLLASDGKEFMVTISSTKMAFSQFAKDYPIEIYAVAEDPENEVATKKVIKQGERFDEVFKLRREISRDEAKAYILFAINPTKTIIKHKLSSKKIFEAFIPRRDNMVSDEQSFLRELNSHSVHNDYIFTTDDLALTGEITPKRAVEEFLLKLKEAHI